MTLKEQMYVCTLARCQSISRASEELFISQPALSIYINNLENFLGVKLFERKGKKLVPTYIGECYIEKAQKMIDLKRDFEDQLYAIKCNTSGRIRIGVQSRRAPHFLAPIIAKFRSEYPDVQIVVHEENHDELEQLYDEGKIDLFIGMYQGERQGSLHTLIYKERLLVALHPEHPANKQATIIQGEAFKNLDLKHLEGEHFILQNKNQSIRKSCEKAMLQAKMKPGSIEEISNMESSTQMVAEGLGIGFNREGYAKYMSYPKPVHYYTFGKEPYTSKFGITYRSDLEIKDYVRRMMEIIVEHGNTPSPINSND